MKAKPTEQPSEGRFIEYGVTVRYVSGEESFVDRLSPCAPVSILEAFMSPTPQFLRETLVRTGKFKATFAYNGQVLDNLRSFEYYNIQDKDTLDVVWSLR